MPDSSKELVVVNPTTGEVLDLHGATTEGLAQAITDLADYRQNVTEFERAVEATIIERCDAEATWTLRVGDPTVKQWEIKTSSPTAGTESYTPDVLEEELRALVDRGTISEGAAAKALKRQVTLTLDVPLGLALKGTAEGLRGVTIKWDDVVLPIASSDYRRASVAAGINALRKVAGTNAALDRAKVTQPVGARRVKVTAKTRDAS